MFCVIHQREMDRLIGFPYHCFCGKGVCEDCFEVIDRIDQLNDGDAVLNFLFTALDNTELRFDDDGNCRCEEHQDIKTPLISRVPSQASRWESSVRMSTVDGVDQQIKLRLSRDAAIELDASRVFIDLNPEGRLITLLKTQALAGSHRLYRTSGQVRNTTSVSPKMMNRDWTGVYRTISTKSDRLILKWDRN